MVNLYNPVMSSEDLFDVSYVDEETFLETFEHNNSQSNVLDLSQKIDSILKNYDEDDETATPVKKPGKAWFHSTPVALPKIEEKFEKELVGPNVKRIAEMFNQKIKDVALNQNYKPGPVRKLKLAPKFLKEEKKVKEEPEKKFSSMSIKEKISLFNNITKKNMARVAVKTPVEPVKEVSCLDVTPKEENANSHKVSLTVIFSPSSDKDSGLFKLKDDTFPAEERSLVTSASKRSFGEVASNLLFELYGPPKKIRKAKFERKSKFADEEPEINTEKVERKPSKGHVSSEKEFVFLKPVALPKKKKVKRTLQWKREESIVEKATFTATDSESDSNSDIVIPRFTTPPLTPTPIMERKIEEADLSEAVDAEQLIQKLKEVNSGSNVKKVYTLTAMSTPSPRLSMAMSKVSRLPSLCESTTETDWDSLPESPARFSIGNSSPLFIKLPENAFKYSSGSRRSSLHGSMNSASTRRMSVGDFDSRRSSVCDSNSRRNSMNMKVIFEEIRNIEQNMKTIKSQVRGIGRSSISPSDSSSGRMSSFWISYGSFRMALDIQFNSQSRLQKCYDIFSEKSADAAKLTFGIDNMKFSFDAAESHADVSKQLSKHRKCSHFWFLADDLIMPFTGPHVAKERITKIFEFLRSSVDNKSELKFGIDNVEFSKRPDAFKYDQKLSLDSNYSMLIGLNGKLSLDGRSKFSWPNTPHKTSDLGSDGFESEFNGSPLMLSPFERTHNYDENNRNSISSFSSFEGVDLIGTEYEQDPVEKIFHAQMNRLPRFA